MQDPTMDTDATRMRLLDCKVIYLLCIRSSSPNIQTNREGIEPLSLVAQCLNCHTTGADKILTVVSCSCLIIFSPGELGGPSWATQLTGSSDNCLVRLGMWCEVRRPRNRQWPAIGPGCDPRHWVRPSGSRVHVHLRGAWRTFAAADVEGVLIERCVRNTQKVLVWKSPLKNNGLGWLGQ